MRIAAKRARQEEMKEPVVEDQPEPDPQVTPKKAKTGKMLYFILDVNQSFNSLSLNHFSSNPKNTIKLSKE